MGDEPRRSSCSDRGGCRSAGSGCGSSRSTAGVAARVAYRPRGARSPLPPALYRPLQGADRFETPDHPWPFRLASVGRAVGALDRRRGRHPRPTPRRAHRTGAHLDADPSPPSAAARLFGERRPSRDSSGFEEREQQVGVGQLARRSGRGSRERFVAHRAINRSMPALTDPPAASTHGTAAAWQSDSKRAKTSSLGATPEASSLRKGRGS